MQKVRLDFIKQNVPQFFYKRLNINNKPLGYFIVPIEMGYAFLLRSIRTKWPQFGNDESQAVSVKIEYVQQVRDTLLQDEPYPAQLISSPNCGGSHTDGSGFHYAGVRQVPAPMPVDMEALGINFSAEPVKNNIILNYFYQRQEDVYLKISIDPILGFEGIVDVLVIGYYIPDLTRKEWS